jgi:BlaI family penicillinase repressor
MTRKNNKHRLDLPPLELRCMAALWTLGKATVHEIRSGLSPERPLAYTTVMTVMERLARKGMVERAMRGRAHLYRPAVTQQMIREHALNQLVENFFQGSRDKLHRHLGSPQNPSWQPAPKELLAPHRPKQKAIRAATESKDSTEIDTSLL